jgi:hypothetical protein
MKKVVIDFVVSQKFGSDNTSFAFGGDCAIKEQSTMSKCTKTLLIEDHIEPKLAVSIYCKEFEKKHKCQIYGVDISVLEFPIYNPKTFVDNAINEDWKTFNVNNIHLILDAYYSKFEDECKQCDIQPINNLNVYAEQMLNQILTDENQREVFYKFVVG